MKKQRKDFIQNLRISYGSNNMLKHQLERLSMGHMARKQTEELSDYLKEFKHVFQELVEANFRNPNCNVDFICRELTCSHSTLYRNVKKCFGCSTSVYLRDFRLKKAKELITVENNSIGEIARKIGYADPAYFSRVFANLFGYAPSESITYSSIGNMALAKVK